jgi:ribonuclease HI
MRFTGNMVLGRRTNNEAEYLAATLGLRAAADLGARFVTLKVDSELLARQVAGRYQVKNARLLPLFMALKQIAAGFERFAVVHVRREFNSAADAQANLALDEQTLARAPSSA